MGYQESFLFCKTKKDMVNLCRVLNHAHEELDAYGVYPYCVGKYKQPIHFSNFFDNTVREHSKKGYFVWWGGERHPIQSGDWLYEYMDKHFGYDYAAFHCVFCEYIGEVDDLLNGINQEEYSSIQKNDFVDVVNLSGDAWIDLKLIKGL